MSNTNLIAALREAEEVLALADGHSIPDPQIVDEVRRLGERFGYGNLMATTSALWSEKAEGMGLGGSEFVAGPCASTVKKALDMVRRALTDGNHPFPVKRI